MAVLGLLGIKRDGIRVGRGLSGTRSPPGCSEQRNEAWDGERGGSGGRMRWGIAGVSSRGLWGALQTRVASVKVQRGLGGAHQGSVRAGV